MNRLIIVVCMVLAVSVVACNKKASVGGASQTGDAAIVGGVPITMSELEEAAKGQLQKVDTQIYQIKKRILDGMVEEKLIEQAAKKAGKSVPEYLAAEIDSKVVAPSDEEVKALYEARKGQIKEPFEKMKDQIAAYLSQNKKGQARQELINKLRTEAGVQIKLEPPRVELDVGDAPSIGNKGAKITLVEFSDYQCPFCKRVRPTLWRLTDEYKDKIRYVFMDFPLSFHRESKKAHEAAHCAGDQDKYFEYNRKIFDNQQAIAPDDLKKYAKELQLNTNDFDKCLDDGKYSKLVDDNTAKGMNVGVSGTPAYFINGIMISGAQPYEAFKEIIDSELQK